MADHQRVPCAICGVERAPERMPQHRARAHGESLGEAAASPTASELGSPLRAPEPLAEVPPARDLRPTPTTPKGWRPGALFWYGAALLSLSFAGGAREGNVLDGLLFVGINWTVFVLPAIVIRNLRRGNRPAPS